jgi:hypothetical protein
MVVLIRHHQLLHRSVVIVAVILIITRIVLRPLSIAVSRKILDKISKSASDSEKPVSVKAFIADYGADIPSLRTLRELSKKLNFLVCKGYGILRFMRYFLTIVVSVVVKLTLALLTTKAVVPVIHTHLSN